MISRIVPVAITISFFTIIVIANCNDINNYDSAQSVRTESSVIINGENTSISMKKQSPVTTTLNVKKNGLAVAPTTVEPTSSKTKLIEIDSIIAEGNYKEGKQYYAGMPPEMETRLEAQYAPVAVPVVTPEEATKRNTQEKTEISLSDLDSISMFEEDIKAESVIRGKVEAISNPIENLSKMDYPNCFISCVVSCIGVICGDDEVPQKMLVYLPEIENRQRVGSLPGKNDIIDLKILPYSNLSGRLQEIQRNDTIFELDMDEYAGVILPPNNYSVHAAARKDNTVQRKQIESLPRTDEAINQRNKQMQEDLEQSEKEYNELNIHLEELSNFFKTNIILPQTDKTDDGGLLINKDGMNLAVYANIVNPFSKQSEAPIKGVESLHALQNFLDNYNIDLIIVPVPERKSFNYIMAFDATKKYKFSEYTKIIYYLRKEGFEVIDIWDGAQRHILPCDTPYNLSNYYPKDIAQIGGYLLANRLKRYGYESKEEFIITSENKVKRGNNTSLNGIHKTYDSPFFTIGNSFGYNPSDGSIRHFGSYYSGIEIDNHNIGDGHLYFGRLLLRNPRFLNKKKACILIVQTYHLSRLENIETLSNINTLYPHKITFDSPDDMNKLLSPHLPVNKKGNALVISFPEKNVEQPDQISIAIPADFQKESSKFLLCLEFATEEQKEIHSVRFAIGSYREESKTDMVAIPFLGSDIVDDQIVLQVSVFAKGVIEIKRISILKQ